MSSNQSSNEQLEGSSNSATSNEAKAKEVGGGGGGGGGVAVAVKTFWDLDGYKEVIRRSTNSNIQLNNLKKMLSERAQHEKAYADSLKKWGDSWKRTTELGTEEESFKEAWMGFVREAYAIRDVHEQMSVNLLQVRKRVSEWQTENFKKSSHLKHIEKDFKTTQDKWVERLNRVDHRQKKYYSACKAEFTVKNSAKSQAVSDMTEEQKRKLEQKERKAHNDRLNAQEKYEKAVNELHGQKDIFRRDMESQFVNAQDFEKTRLEFMKDAMLHSCAHLNVESYSGFSAINPALKSVLSNASPQSDLEDFAKRRGPSQPLTYPSYQEWSIEMLGQSLSSTAVKASVKSVIDNSVALGENSNIESGQGSYRARADTSPPNATAIPKFATTNSSTAPSDSSLNHSSVSGSQQNLPPPPESSSLASSKMTPSSSPRSQASKVPTKQTSMAAIVSTEKVPQATSSSHKSGNSKTETLELTNPFKFNTLNRDESPADNPFDNDVEDDDSHSATDHVYTQPEKVERSSIPPPPPDSDPDTEDEDEEDGLGDHTHRSSHSQPSTSAPDVSQPQAYPRTVANRSDSVAKSLNSDEDEVDNHYHSMRRDSTPSPPPDTNGEATAHPTGSAERDESKVEYQEGVPVRALYAYQADEDDEISLMEGEHILKLSEADENGWSYGFRRNRYGLYPASYVEPI